MRFYRLHLTHDAGVSSGAQWFTTHRAARAARAEWLKDNPGETADLDPIDITPTRAGILRVLNQWASHPDNG